MNANFEKEVKMNHYIHQMYKNAKEVNDEEGMEFARTKYEAFEEDIKSRGDDYVFFFRKFINANERGNELIDFDDCVWEKNLPAMIEGFRKFGIEQFTMSSGFSSMNKTVWELLQNGCELAGMTLVKSAHTEMKHENGEFYDVRVDVPAFLFNVK